MDRTLDFGSNSEGSNPSAVTKAPFLRGFFCYSIPKVMKVEEKMKVYIPTLKRRMSIVKSFL